MVMCIFQCYSLNFSLIAQLVKNPPAIQGPRFDSWVRKIPWRRKRLPTPVFWPGEFHGQRLQVMGSQRVGHDWATNTHHIIVEDMSGLKRTGLKNWVRVFLSRIFQDGTAEQEKAQHRVACSGHQGNGSPVVLTSRSALSWMGTYG